MNVKITMTNGSSFEIKNLKGFGSFMAFANSISGEGYLVFKNMSLNKANISSIEEIVEEINCGMVQ